ncbi:MAG: tetratricopeptide repeat protein [Flavobacteriia bacterium]|nr:tetratricopeptide repeat protein [Cryomorphaceae bacterium]
MKNLAILIGTALLSSSAFAQKNNETSAAIEYNKFKDQVTMMMMGGGSDFPAMQATIKKAKEYIDLAAANETTKMSPKTLFYKGEIYTGYLMAFATDTVFANTEGENYLNIGLAAYKQSLSVSTKYKGDIQESLLQKKSLFGLGIDQLYKEEKYAETGEAYELQVKLSDAMNQVDTVSLFNAGICYEKAKNYMKAGEIFSEAARLNYKLPFSYAKASGNFRLAGKSDLAKNIINEGRKKFPTDRDLLLELVNISIDEGDNAGAEAALAAAIATDPNNKVLHYTIGTIYSQLKQNDKAEAALNKALEIDPQFDDALYQLGAILVTWAGETKTAANQLKFGDARYDTMLKEADDIYKRALIPLEKYIAKNPNDKDVLTILFQLHRSLGNSEKAIEFKKRADAIK